MIRLISFNDLFYPGNEPVAKCYAYDDTVGVHLCELAMSREMHFLGTSPFVVPENDDSREKFLNLIMESDNQEEEITYMHANRVDSRKYVESHFNEDSPEENLENTKEDYRCNGAAYEMKLTALLNEKD